jgi:hypothetical protein
VTVRQVDGQVQANLPVLQHQNPVDRVLVLQDGKIGLDLTIDLPNRHSYRDPRFAQYREVLLAALGVQTSIDGPIGEIA